MIPPERSKRSWACLGQARKPPKNYAQGLALVPSRANADTSSDPLAPWRSRYRAGSPWSALFLRAHDLAQ
jgi:hypothetical protein